MDSKFRIKVNETYDFEIGSTEVNSMEFAQKDANAFYIVEKNTSYHLKKNQSNFDKKSYKVFVNGNTYEVKIEDYIDILIKELGLTVNGKQKDSNIKAPMPGLILEVQVKVGQEVKEGDVLMVLEAMKMENMLTAPKDGIVKEISVVKGDAVEKKQLLIEME